MVAAALKPGGTVFFVDGRREPSSTASDHQLPDKDSELMTRKLNDGRAFNDVKNFYEPSYLEHGARPPVSVLVQETSMYFIYGAGRKDT